MKCPRGENTTYLEKKSRYIVSTHVFPDPKPSEKDLSILVKIRPLFGLTPKNVRKITQIFKKVVIYNQIKLLKSYSTGTHGGMGHWGRTLKIIVNS
jgi:hypothetical protein